MYYICVIIINNKKLTIMRKEDLQEIMLTAWHFVKEYNYTMRDALKKAWICFDVKNEMLNGIVEFSFEKKNGELRKASGTLSQNIAPVLKGSEKKKNITVQSFFDVEINSWRSFSKINLLI